MRRSALILTYHAVEAGPPPLCVDPSLFAEQLDALVAAGARALTISELASALERGQLPERAVAITFDDGFASVAEHAAPLLAERGLPATVYSVAGALGRLNDWPSQPPRAPRRRLASTAQLRELSDSGFEIGSHGVEHAPLALASPAAGRREVVESKQLLEDSLGRPVTSFAYPYGAMPQAAVEQLVRQTYAAACTTDLALARPHADVLRLPRVDVHYVRQPERLRRALEGSLDTYLRVRRTGASCRRLVRKDYRAVRAA